MVVFHSFISYSYMTPWCRYRHMGFKWPSSLVQGKDKRTILCVWMITLRDQMILYRYRQKIIMLFLLPILAEDYQNNMQQNASFYFCVKDVEDTKRNWELINMGIIKSSLFFNFLSHVVWFIQSSLDINMSMQYPICINSIH